MGAGCSNTPRVLVVAACEGMVSLFEKSDSGSLKVLPVGDAAVAASPDGFQRLWQQIEEGGKSDQLVIVGSSNDIAWIHASLPVSVAGHISAEIKYPLVSGWFRQLPDMQGLTNALEHLLRH